jgi:CelD/BcsL family acetyltransferase involved in cellulose biosynthesis
MKEFYRYASQVSSNSWKEEIGGPGFGGTVGEAAALNLAKAGLARGYVLFHEQKPVAYVFCRSNHEHLIYKHIGYHREYRKWSPGTVLLYLMLERLFVEQKYEFLDLGEGTLGYKSFFSTHGIRCVRVIYFRRSLRNFIIVFAHAGLTEGSIAAGKILARLKVKHAIKRTLMGKLYRPAQES